MDFETATKILLDYKESDIRSTDDEIKERFTGNQTRLRAFFNECYVNDDIDRLRRFKNLIIDTQEELNSGNDLKKMGLSEDNEPFFQLPLRIRKITDYSQKTGTSYLNELLKEINSIIKLSEKEQPRKTESDELTLKQIALLYIYRREIINNDNANEVAEKYGYKSGKKLTEHYNKYQSTNDRKGDEGSQIKNKNKINDIEKIIPLLDEPQQKQAIDEIEALKIIVENQSI